MAQMFLICVDVAFCNGKARWLVDYGLAQHAPKRELLGVYGRIFQVVNTSVGGACHSLFHSSDFPTDLLLAKVNKLDCK
jgi:hypothetical protein